MKKTSKAVATKKRKRPAGKPKGKAQGVKPKPNKDQPMEFRLKIKPNIEIFWSFNEKSWVVACEAETGKKMSMTVNTASIACSVKEKALAKGDVNPNHWTAGVKKHPQDVIGNESIRVMLIDAPGLTNGKIAGNGMSDEMVLYVWASDANKGKDEDIPALWSCPARSFTRAELCNLQRIVDAYKMGHEYAIASMGGKKRRK